MRSIHDDRRPRRGGFHAPPLPHLLSAAIAIALVVVLATWWCYNRLVRSNEAVGASWAQVMNVMRRRSELVPNLVAVTAAYAGREHTLLDSVSAVRAAYLSSTTLDAQVDHMRRLETVSARLLAIGERYPELEASRPFTQLRFELLGTENRIAIERGRYNESVRAYRTLRRTWPSSVVARAFALPDPPEY